MASTTQQSLARATVDPHDVHDRHRAAHVAINEVFVQAHDGAELDAFVRAIVRTARFARRSTEFAEVARELRRQVALASLRIGEVEADSIADEIIRARGQVHISIDGRVLYGDPTVEASIHEPDVDGDEDSQSRPWWG